MYNICYVKDDKIILENKEVINKEDMKCGWINGYFVAFFPEKDGSYDEKKGYLITREGIDCFSRYDLSFMFKEEK